MADNIPSDLSLKDLVGIKEWQRIQDNFSNVTRISICTVNPQGDHITSPSSKPRLCTELLKEFCKKKPTERVCMPTFLGGRGVVDRNLSYVCDTGMHNFIVPLKVDESKVLGYIVLGPVILVMRKPKDEYKQMAEKLNVNLDDFWSALLEVKVASFHGMQSMVELVKDICEYTIKAAYKVKVK